MHHFFVNPGQVEDGLIRITGPDVNHIKNVLRVRQGEKMLVSDGTGRDYLCQAEEIAGQEVVVRIFETEEEGRELPSRIWLFQGLPKSDKMEFIIQKAVELGAASIVPVSTRNTVVKLDPQKGRGQGASGGRPLQRALPSSPSAAWFRRYPAS